MPPPFSRSPERSFAEYTRGDEKIDLPAQPGADGYRFYQNHLELFRPVELNNKRVGTIFLQADLGRMYDQLRLYAGIVGLVLLGAFIMTFALSPRLRGPIAEPILALVETARQVAENKDYSFRTVKRGKDEVGLLSDSFNEMLAAIESGQNKLKQANQSMQAEIAERKSAEDRLREQTREIVQSINVLVSSAEQILSTTTELAASASQTATSVSETTTTIEEVRQTAVVASEKAKHVAESASTAAQRPTPAKRPPRTPLPAWTEFASRWIRWRSAWSG